MNYLLDTCVVSEFVKKTPNENLIKWIQAQDEHKLFLSVVTIGELFKGVNKLPANDSRYKKLTNWVNNDLLQRFAERILVIDSLVMMNWGKLTGGVERKGKKIPVIDSLIAAIAITHNLIIVTRNINDLKECSVKLENPWNN